MRRVAVLFAVATCGVMCSLLLAGASMAQDRFNFGDFDSQEQAQAVLERGFATPRP